MSQSVKSKWQTEIVRSGLGAGPVGVGMVMSSYADADGTRVWPSMTAVAKGMGCSRGYVERHCAALVEHDRLATVAKAIPRRRGIEYRLTFGRAETVATLLQPEAESMPATLLQSGTNSAPIWNQLCSNGQHNHEKHHVPKP